MELADQTSNTINFQFSARLTEMLTKWFSPASLLDFPNVTGPNDSKHDTEISLFAGAVTR